MATERRGEKSNELGRQPATDPIASSTPSSYTAESLDVFDAVTRGTTTDAARAPAPSLVPGDGTVAPDRAAGESAPGTLAPEVQRGSSLIDQFGQDIRQGGSPTGFYGDRSLELPSALEAVDLMDRAGPEIDVGVDFENLGNLSPLDGRTPDAFDGLRQSGATGPADPGGMISDGKGQQGSPYTTSGDADTAAAEKAVDALIAGIQAGTKHNPYVIIQEEIVGSVVDVPAVERVEAAGETTAESSKSNVELKNDQWNFIGDDVPVDGHGDGGLPAKSGTTTWIESWKGLFNDDLPPDHPDYTGTPDDVPPGSATDGSIERSLLLGLGGQRGGDVDPHGDGETETRSEALFDPKDSVIDPGEDGFVSTFEADRSMLGGPMDHIAPELANDE